MAKISAVKAEDDWVVEDALRTLMRAKEIKADAKLMKKVKAMAQKRLQEVASVAGAIDDKDGD